MHFNATPVIQVKHKGRLALMSETNTVIRGSSVWDGGVRCELTRSEGTSSATDRTAVALLLRLQLHGSSRIKGNAGRTAVDSSFGPQTFGIFPRGYHLDKPSWEARQSETLFFSVDEVPHRDCSLTQSLAKISAPCFGFQDRTLLNLFDVLRSSMVNGEANGPLFAEGISLAICSHLVHSYSNVSPQRIDNATLTQARLKQVREFVEENVGSPLTLACLAEQAGLSRYHFVRAFKKAMGVTPFEYVTQARLKSASTLLRKENLSLAEVALAAGFSSQSHMTTTFTRFTGVTPGCIRRRQDHA